MCLDLAETTSTIFQRYSILNCQTFWQTPVRKKNCAFCFSCCLRWSFWRSQQYQAKQLLGWYCCLKTLSINFSGKAVPGNPITDKTDHGKPRNNKPILFSSYQYIRFSFFSAKIWISPNSSEESCCSSQTSTRSSLTTSRWPLYENWPFSHKRVLSKKHIFNIIYSTYSKGKPAPGNPITDEADHGKPSTGRPILR